MLSITRAVITPASAIAAICLLCGFAAQAQPTMAEDVPQASDQTDQPATVSPAPVPARPLQKKAIRPARQIVKPARKATAGATNMSINKEGRFSGYYRDTDLRVVLRSLSMQGGVNIIPTREVGGRVTATLHKVTFEEALESVLVSSGMKYRKKGKFIYIYTAKQMFAIMKAEKLASIRTKSYKLSYITSTDAQVLIAPALSGAGSVTSATPASATGIAGDEEVTGGNSYATSDLVVVRDFQENLDSVGKLLAEIDVRPEQVLVEVTILSASTNDRHALGVNFNVLLGADFQTVGMNSAGGLTNISQPLTPALAMPNVSTAGVIRTDFPVVSGGLQLGLVTDRLSAFVRALETVADVTVLANPKLMVINKQKGEIHIGGKVGYLSTVVSEGISSQQVEFLETGTKLYIRPFIGKDGYIRLEIHPKDSDGSVINGLPSETTTEVVSNILVKDGQTVVIGGLFRENLGRGKSQIPVLGNLPIIGTIFRSSDDTTAREEVIILITPHIVKQEDAARNGKEAKRDVERYRVGARKSLQWWSTTRLANENMKRAREALKAGDIEKARWNVDMALTIRPRMIEAIEQREQLDNKAYWAEEARFSTIRFLIHDLMLKELESRPIRLPVKVKPLHLPNKRNLKFKKNLKVKKVAFIKPSAGSIAAKPAARKVLVKASTASKTVVVKKTK